MHVARPSSALRPLIRALKNSREISQPLHLPLAAEAGEAGLAGEELLHGGLFEVALLGDEPVQPAQQRIHVAQRLSDGALLVAERSALGCEQAIWADSLC